MRRRISGVISTGYGSTCRSGRAQAGVAKHAGGRRHGALGRNGGAASRGDAGLGVLDHIPVVLTHFVIAGHSASEDARERAYDPAIHPFRKKFL
jgi:hypothetical protein